MTAPQVVFFFGGPGRVPRVPPNRMWESMAIHDGSPDAKRMSPYGAAHPGRYTADRVFLLAGYPQAGLSPVEGCPYNIPQEEDHEDHH